MSNINNNPNKALTQNDLSDIDFWQRLQQFTDARVALGRAGCSVPTTAMLQFQLAHAQAKDAVLQTLDTAALVEQLGVLPLQKLLLYSQATDKQQYLQRPDLGRVLSDDSRQQLQQFMQSQTVPQQTAMANAYDVVLVIADGLSARAISDNAARFAQEFIFACTALGWSLAPIVIAQGSRVALGDEIAEILQAKMLVMLIGERPGLSSPDSMGIYYTLNAKVGCHDAMRNCISNVRPAGLSIPMAVQRLLALMQQSLKLQCSGVHLKDQHQVVEVSNQSSVLKLF